MKVKEMIDKKSSLWKSLTECMKDMDLPEKRKTDLNWLMKNMAIRNSDNKNLERAINIIREIVSMS